MIFIAEIKTCSPFGFRSPFSSHYLFKVAIELGDWISVHVDSRWCGSYSLLNSIAKRTNKPILAKGIPTNKADVYRAFDCGANYALVVGRKDLCFEENGKVDKRVIFEPTSFEQLFNLPSDLKIIWNARNLNTGLKKNVKFDIVRNLIPNWLCQASMIRNKDDIHEFADACLVGENLLNFKQDISLNNET